MKSETIKIEEKLDCMAWLPKSLKRIVMKAAGGPDLDYLAGMKPDAINKKLGLSDENDIGNDVQKAALESSTSMLYWWPLLSKIKGLNVPKTRIIQVSREEVTHATVFAGEHDNSDYKKDSDEIKESKAEKDWENFASKYLPRFKQAWVQVAGGLDRPVFMRTDNFSSKHDWKNTCYLPQYEDRLFHQHFFTLIENSECADFFGLKINGIVFREFLDLDTRFTFFNGEMPVGAERRYFIRDGDVICHHVYWIEDVFKHDCEQWNNLIKHSEIIGITNPKLKPKTYPKEILQELNIETPEEVQLLTGYAKSVAEVFSGFWSVDFARAKDGTWFLIDMARGEQSWHDEQCVNAATKQIDDS